MTAITFELALPSRDLSSNARVHWARKGRAVRAYRQEAKIMALQALLRAHTTLRAPVSVTYAFGTKGSRRAGLYGPLDHSNAIDSIKAAQDGLADVLGFDDCAKNMRLDGVTIDRTDGAWVRVTVTECD